MRQKTIAIVQARSSSSRLPLKVLLPILGKPLIVHLLKRISKSKLVDLVVLATSSDPSDDLLARIVQENSFEVFRGSLHNVLERFIECSNYYKAKSIVRITGDCPLMDHHLIDEIVGQFHVEDVDYLANNMDSSSLSVPDGFDIEVFNYASLEKANHHAFLESDLEHVTPWIKKNLGDCCCRHFIHKPFRPFFRLTVDDQNDFDVINAIFSEFRLNSDFSIDDVIHFLSTNPSVASQNNSTLRNEGYLKSVSTENDFIASSCLNGKGQILWKEAQNVIAGGNMLLSKNPDLFLPDLWPSYYSRAKGCEIWDLDGNKYIDMSIMGIGTNLLGYSNPEVDSNVISAVTLGNMSTLNCPEEVELAHKLVKMHPWADMARFARSGGEANAIAIRIARAFTQRDTVAICGYHGWHDWYLAANLTGSSGLSQHLLPGLEPLGVPKSLEGTVQPFQFNSHEQVSDLFNRFDLAAVKMEVQRSEPPKPGFLESIRKLCDLHGTLLIFDECTSGFRESFGGIHLNYSVQPDIAMFGKALGNGYSITSIIGRSEVMKSCEKTFISSTFWTERIGPVAALKTLEVMERDLTWKLVTNIGASIKSIWQALSDKYSVPININGIDSLASFVFISPHHLEYKTFLTQEMLKHGFLASTIFYASTCHSLEFIEEYHLRLDTVFKVISQCENDGRNINDLLESRVCQSGFKRLN